MKRMHWIALALLLVCIFGAVFYFDGTEAQRDTPFGIEVGVSSGTVKVGNGADERTLTAGDKTIATADGEFVDPVSEQTSSGIVSGEAGVNSTDPADSTVSDSTIMDVSKEEYSVAGYVLTESGSPLSGASVTMRSRVGNEEREQTTRSDDKGYYIITLDTPASGMVQSIPAEENYAEARQYVELTEEEKSKQVNFSHVIAPLVVRGKVIDKETSAPIAGADVRASGNREIGYQRLQAVTGSDGTFVIRRIKSGSFNFNASAKGYITFSPATIEERDASPLSKVIIDENTQNQEIVIPLEPGFAVKIRVLDKSRRPVADADVKAHSSKDLYDTRSLAGKTDSRGEFTIDTLPQGKAVASAQKDGYGETVSEAFDPGEKTSPPVVEIVMREPASVSGRVVTSSGEPLPDRRVTVSGQEISRKLGGFGNAGIWHDTQSDGNGSYTFAGLGEGGYRLTAHSADTINRDAELEISLKEGERKTGVDLVVTEGTEEVHGVVVNESGQPVSNANVVAGIITIRDGNYKDSFHDTVTDANGEFHYTKLEKPDQFSLRVIAEGYSNYRYDGDLPKEKVTVTMRKSGSIGGVVIAKDTREPVAGARATLTGSQQGTSNHSALTGQDGSFRMEGIEYGFYQVMAEAEGYSRTTGSPFMLEQGESKEDVVVEIESAAQVKGLVTNANGEPVRGAKVAVLSRINNSSRNMMGVLRPAPIQETVLTNADGTFEINDLSPQGDTLLVGHDNYAPKRGSVTPDMLASGAFVNIVLTQGGAIEGSVFDREGKPVQGAGINIFNYPDNLYAHQLVTDENGYYKVEKLSPESFMVMKIGDTYAVDADYKQVVVKEGETVRADFGGGEGTTVRGTVYKGNAPAPNTQIQLTGNVPVGMDRTQFVTRAFDDGSYVFKAVPPGEYLVIFTTNPAERYLSPFNSEGLYELSIAQQREIALDLYANAYEITGTVKDAQTGEPIADANVELQMGENYSPLPAPLNETAMADEGGRFSISALVPGNYMFVASKKGYEQQWTPVNVQPSPSGTGKVTLRQDLALSKSGAAIHAYLKLNGEPFQIPNLNAILIRDGYQQYLPLNEGTNENGAYVIDGLMAGQVALQMDGRLNNGSYFVFPQPVTLVKGQPSNVICNVQEVRDYRLELIPNDDRNIFGPAVVEIEGFPTSSMVRNFVHSNGVNLKIPFGEHKVRLSISGYRPVEFVPQEIATPGDWAMQANIRLPLSKN